MRARRVSACAFPWRLVWSQSCCPALGPSPTPLDVQGTPYQSILSTVPWTNTLLPPSVPVDPLQLPGKPRAVRRVLLSGRARRRTPSTADRGPCTLVCGALKSTCALWPCAGVLKTLGASYADAAQAKRQSGQSVMPREDALPLLQSMLDRSDEPLYAQWCAI